MNNESDCIKVNIFWDWFTKNCQNFGSNFENALLLNELDVWISKLGNYSWEVGPGKIEDNALVISPNGNLELLKETKEIVEHAKKCHGWEYYYAKPPKEWNLIFEYETSAGIPITINASKWRYVLLKYDDGMFQIILETSRLNLTSDEDKLAIAEIALDGILGEELRMKTIDEIDFVDDLENLYKDKASNIADLSNHVKFLNG